MYILVYSYCSLYILYIYIIRFIIKAKPLFKTCLTFRISTLWVLYKTISDRSFSFIEV